MRQAARIDRNQTEIVSAFRKFGCSVWPAHQMGGGFPDLVVGKHGKTILVECKDGQKAPSGRKLTQDQEKFHKFWLGSVYIVEDLEDVIALVKGLEK